MIIKQKELVNNGYTLRGLFSTPDESFDNIVVMFHGFTGHMNENGFLFKQLTKTLTDNNIATLRYDFMGSGISDGEFSEFSFFTELSDAKAIIEEAYKLNNNKKIFVLGFSMGGAVASRISLEMKDYIEKLVLLSPAGNMPELLKARVENPLISDGKMADMGGFYMNCKISTVFEGYDMYKDIETFDKPVLIMQGSADKSVPPTYSKRYDELYPNSKYILVDGAEHCYTKVEYRKIVNQKVLEFLKNM